jgi:ribosomal protein S18 acetylase RimI-like enzyme
MAGYRFCRTDDIPRLVEAYNRCFAVHFDDVATLTVEGYKALVRDIDLWPSSCMLATVDGDDIGVLFATKRDRHALIHSIGIRQDHLRQGHGRHLLDSLSQKLAILGPPELVAEVPAEAGVVRAFLEACGYGAATTYEDYMLGEPSGEVAETGYLTPVTFADLRESGALDPTAERSWGRSFETLANRAERLEGLAVASDVRVEAYVLWGADDSEVVAFGSAPGERPRAFLRVLVHHLSKQVALPLTIPQVSAGEAGPGEIEGWGFRRVREYVAYTRQAGERG